MYSMHTFNGENKVAEQEKKGKKLTRTPGRCETSQRYSIVSDALGVWAGESVNQLCYELAEFSAWVQAM